MTHSHLVAALMQSAPAHPHGLGGFLHRLGDTLTNFFRPLGAWGLAGIALLDSALLPMPWQGLLIYYVHANPSKFLLYPLVAALASALGSLVPYYVGRLGGELFLLGRINRERYERLRDRFEQQEFLAILLPAMGPPPTPIKLFEFCAGVFEMKPLPFVAAIFLGKMVQFVVYAVITHYYGPTAFQALTGGIKEHAHLMLTLAGLLIVVIAVWFVRKLFARGKNETILPAEETNGGPGKHTVVEE
jgi:membrane protein YqaA with SNARE-associated domain